MTSLSRKKSSHESAASGRSTSLYFSPSQSTGRSSITTKIDYDTTNLSVYQRNEVWMMENRMKKDEMFYYLPYYRQTPTTYLVIFVTDLFFFQLGWFITWYEIEGELTAENLGLSEEMMFLILHVVVFAACAMGRYTIDWLGPKYTMYISNISLIMCIFLFLIIKIDITVNIVLFILTLSFGFYPVCVYALECSPVNFRATIIASTAFGYYLGVFLSSRCLHLIQLRYQGYSNLVIAAIGIFAIVQLIVLYILPMSPTLLCILERSLEAEKSLMRLRRVPYVTDSILRIRSQLECQNRKITGNVFMRYMKTSHLRKSLVMGFMLLLLQTSSHLMISDLSHKIKTASSAVFSIQHTTFQDSSLFLIMSFLSIFVLEHLGNVNCLKAAYTINTSIFLFASFVLFTGDLRTDQASHYYSPSGMLDNCSKLENCLECVANKNCSYCHKLAPDNTRVAGFCSTVQHQGGGHYSRCQDSPEFEATNLCTVSTAAEIIMNATLFFKAVFILFASDVCSLFYAIEIAPIWARSTVGCLSVALYLPHTFFQIAYTNNIYFKIEFSAFYTFVISTTALVFILNLIRNTTGVPLEYCDMLHMSSRERKYELNRREKRRVQHLRKLRHTII